MTESLTVPGLTQSTLDRLELPGGTPEAALQLRHWQAALPLAHPNLLKLHSAGESELAAEPIIYLVSERADESLAQVLEDRPLTEQEAREMLEPILSAFAYLHAHGFAHNGIRPANVRASGDTLKLTSATLLPMSSGGDPSADMRSLGTLLVQSLTRDLKASEPLSGIIRHLLDPDRSQRWTAEQALAHLQPVPEPKSRTKLYVAAGAALLIAAAIGLTTKKDPIPPPAPSSAPIATTTPNPPPQTPILRAPRSPGWVVVVASYAARGPAEKRALQIAKRWPRFHTEVFEPPSQRTRNLVILGKNLTQEKADALRKRARQSGLPRDVYIKRFE